MAEKLIRLEANDGARDALDGSPRSLPNLGLSPTPRAEMDIRVGTNGSLSFFVAEGTRLVRRDMAGAISVSGPAPLVRRERQGSRLFHIDFGEDGREKTASNESRWVPNRTNAMSPIVDW